MSRSIWRAVWAAGPFLFGAAAHAQTVPPPASQVTPRDLRPAPEAPRTAAPRGPAANAPPAGSERLSFTPSRIEVTGGYPALQARTDALLAPFSGRTLTVADFYAIGDRVQQLYVAAGFPLARVVVPAQSLTDGGVARFQLVDGVVEAIDTSAVPSHLRRPIEAILRPLTGRGQLPYRTLERRLLLAGQVPGVSLRSALAPGRAAGTTRLVVESGYDPLGVTVNFDDLSSAAFDHRNFTVQATANGLIGRGEQIYLFASSDPLGRYGPFSANARRSVVGGGISAPLNNDGLRINLEATRSRTQPLGGFFITRDRFDRASLRLSYPLILTRRDTLTLQTAFEALREVQVLPQFGGAELSHDRFLIQRFGADYATGWPGIGLQSGATISFGRGYPNANAPFSRGAATTHFTRVEGNAALSARMPLGFVAAATVRGAAVLTGGVPNAELFALDGQSALSSFTAGALTADEGATVRLQFSRAFAATRTWALIPYAFAAGGVARYALPTPFDVHHAAAYGLGLSTDLRFIPIGTAVSATVEYGRGVADGPFPDRDRFSFQLGLRF